MTSLNQFYDDLEAESESFLDPHAGSSPDPPQDYQHQPWYKSVLSRPLMFFGGLGCIILFAVVFYFIVIRTSGSNQSQDPQQPGIFPSSPSEVQLYDTPFEASSSSFPTFFANQIKVEYMMRHLSALMSIASEFIDEFDRPSGSRSVQFGANRSRDYIVKQLQIPEYRDFFNITVQHFTYNEFQVEKIEPSPELLIIYNGTEEKERKKLHMTVMSYSGPANLLQGTLYAPEIDLLFCLPGKIKLAWKNDALAERSSPPYAKFVLISRGNCTFLEKAQNALDAGADAVLIHNNAANASEPVQGTLSTKELFQLPVVGVTREVGEFLRNENAARYLQLSFNSSLLNLATSNVVADIISCPEEGLTQGPDKNTPQTLIFGAHLDSVDAGPGINDNGSGSAALLAIAQLMAEFKSSWCLCNEKIQPKLRFAWWGAEEPGLVGSDYYVRKLSSNQVKSISLYLNFDMLGSPNGGRLIYNSSSMSKESSAALVSSVQNWENLLSQVFKSRGLSYFSVPFDGRSDYGPFLKAGIPSQAIETGADDVMTSQMTDLFGGTANLTLDPCYHQSCDNTSNIKKNLYTEMTKVIAETVMRLATTKKSFFQPSTPLAVKERKALQPGIFPDKRLRKSDYQ